MLKFLLKNGAIPSKCIEIKQIFMNTCFLSFDRYMGKEGVINFFLYLGDPFPWVWELHTKDDLIAVSVKF